MTVLPDDPLTAIRELADEVAPRLIDIRRDLHAHPELAFGEVRTAAVVVRELARLGIAYQSGIGSVERAVADARVCLSAMRDPGVDFAGTLPARARGF